MKLTYDEFIEKVKQSGKTKFNLHDCSMCGYNCGYIVEGDQVYYDSGCYCTGSENISERSFEDFFQALDMQSEKYTTPTGRVISPYQKLLDKLFAQP